MQITFDTSVIIIECLLESKMHWDLFAMKSMPFVCFRQLLLLLYYSSYIASWYTLRKREGEIDCTLDPLLKKQVNNNAVEITLVQCISMRKLLLHEHSNHIIKN